MKEFERLRDLTLEPDFSLEAADVIEIEKVHGASRKFDYLTFEVRASGLLDWSVGSIVRFTHPRFHLVAGENVVLVDAKQQGGETRLTLVGLRWTRSQLEKNPDLPDQERRLLAEDRERNQKQLDLEAETLLSREPQAIEPQDIVSKDVVVEQVPGQPARIIHLSVRLQAIYWALGTSVSVTYPLHGMEKGANTTLLSAKIDLMAGRSDLRLLWAPPY